jgi:hypothetical protein
MYSFTPVASDADDDPLVFSLTNRPSWINLNTTTGSLTGTPTSAGTTPAMVLSVSDGKTTTSLPSFSITVSAVNPTNNIPVAVNDSFSLNEDTQSILTVIDNDSDPDNDQLIVSSVTQPSHGSLTINLDNTVTFTPTPNFWGTDSFTYTIQDGNGGSSEAGVDLNIASVDDVPTAFPDAATTEQNTAVAIDLSTNDSGLGDAPLTYVITSMPNNGNIAMNGQGRMTYTPDPDFIGSDSFMYQVSDSDNDSSSANVNINVTGSYAIRISWAPNPETDILGYYVYHGVVDGNFSDPIWVGNVTSYDFETTVAGTHYFALSAVNSSNVESALSTQSGISF